MKKMVSLLLSLSMLLSFVGIMQVSAAEVSSSFKDDTSFYFSFENESDFTHPDMLLDSVGASSFQTPGVTRYTQGVYGSKGAVALHLETASGNGNANDGISNIKMIPGKAYELTMDFKLFSSQNFAALPNINLFFMTQNVQMYRDEACTEPDSVSSSNYQLFTIQGNQVFRYEEDGTTVSGDWCRFNQNITLTNVFNDKYVKPDEPVNVKLFIRLGGNPHALNNKSDFTQAFLDECGTLTDGRPALWIEYAIDNIGLRPVSIEPEEVAEEDTALWRASFEDGNWAKETAGVEFSGSYAKLNVVNDVPAEIQDKSQGALEFTYSGNTDNNGYVDFNAVTSNNDKKMWYNRVYEISFWAKGSQAVADFYANEGRKTQIIPERGSDLRLDRTFPKWQGYTVNEPITTEWTKYTYLYYEEMPMALGRDGEAAWDTRFHIRYSCVPGKKTNDLTTEVNGETIQYAYQSGDNYYKLEDFKFYLDDFTVTPLDIVYNGNLEKTDNAADYSVIWYTGADNRINVTSSADPLSSAIFHNGTIETVSDFPETGSKNVLSVAKDGGAPYQSADIENGKTYQISFWAKANDAESAGQSVNVVLDRDIQGEILDDTEPTFTGVPQWAGYRIDNSVTQDITLNKEQYDGYGAPLDPSQIGSIPFYLYGGVCAHVYHNPFVLSPTNYEETLVYDDYYDRMFSKNTQEGEEPTAWAYQYYDGTAWVGTNDKTEITSTQTLNEEWTLYTMEYQWDYPGMHYRMPKLTFADNANYSLTDIRIEEIETEDPDVKPEFHIENLQATGGEVLSSSDSIDLTWDFVSTGTAEATEADGGSLIKVYADNGGELALIGTTRADKAGETKIKASADLFGKDLVFEVIPVDTDGNYGIGATAAFAGKIALSVTSDITLNLDYASADWSASVLSDGVEGTISAYIAMYNENSKLISIEETPLAYASGENEISGTVQIPEAATTVKLFVWNSELKPMTTEKKLSLMPVNDDPFAGDSEINVVFLGDSIYAPANGWVKQVGDWFKTTYGKNGVTVNAYNKGVGGTTTDYSLVRVMRDVVAYDPDVVFFSHTCNDGNRDTRRNMESVVRTLMSLDNPPYIIFTRTTNRSFSQSNGYGNQVAEFYGLPLIDDLEAFKAATTGTGVTITDLFGSDGVHPNDAGHKVIADNIIACMQSGRYYQKPLAREDKLIENSGAIAEATWFSSTDTSKVERTGSWTTGGNYVQSSAAGDTLKFTFTGDIMAFEYGLHKDSGLIEVWVDGELELTCNPRYNDSIDSYQLVCKGDSILLDLEYGTHTVTMKTVANPDVTGSQVDRIFGIMTGSWVQE